MCSPSGTPTLALITSWKRLELSPTHHREIKWTRRERGSDSQMNLSQTLWRRLEKSSRNLWKRTTSGHASDTDLDPERVKVNKVLSEHGLSYMKGGYIALIGSTDVSRTLQDIINARDLPGLQTEFDRSLDNVESDPASAVTASCALLESLFKNYIEKENLETPSDKSVKPLWKVIRADLKFDPAATQDADLKTILSGLAAIVEGTGSLRTHKGSAHGHGKTVYKLKPRHARLAVHAAFTLASFVLEAWDERGAS